MENNSTVIKLPIVKIIDDKLFLDDKELSTAYEWEIKSSVNTVTELWVKMSVRF